MDNHDDVVVGTTFTSGASLTVRSRSQDDKINSFVKILRNMCKIHNIVVLNGSTDGNNYGCFTYMSPHGNSVIDYGLIVASQGRYSIDLTVADRIESSDIPIEITLGPRKTLPIYSQNIDINEVIVGFE